MPLTNHKTPVKLLATVLTLFAAGYSLAQDTDGDGVFDLVDNCSTIGNPTQLDVDTDLLGNACDPDFNNDGAVNFLDFVGLTGAFQTVNPTFDLNGDGIVNFLDIAMFVPFFNGTPGPGATGASYSANVQPILVTKCAPCHTGLNLGDHDIGTNYGDALAPADDSSCDGLLIGECSLVRVQAGEMPQGAGCTGDPVLDAGIANCLTYSEQNLLFSWINGGLSP